MFVIVALLLYTINMTNMQSDKVRITGWNMNGFYTSWFYLYEVMQHSDVICISEHKLYNCDFPNLRNAVGDFQCHIKQCAELEPWNHGIIPGYGGVAIIYRNDLAANAKMLNMFHSD
jgi:exonuclease III